MNLILGVLDYIVGFGGKAHENPFALHLTKSQGDILSTFQGNHQIIVRFLSFRSSTALGGNPASSGCFYQYLACLIIGHDCIIHLRS